MRSAATQKLGDERPVVAVERAARRHRGRHQQHGPRLRPDRVAQRLAVERPGAARGETEGHEAGHAAGEANPVDEAGIGGIGHDDLVADLDRREENVEDPRQPAGRDDAVPLAGIGDPRQSGDVAGSRLAQPALADERQVAVVRFLGRGAPRPLDRLGIGRDVDVEILQPQEIAARGIRDRPHAVDADPGNPVQPLRATSVHGALPGYCSVMKSGVVAPGKGPSKQGGGPGAA